MNKIKHLIRTLKRCLAHVRPVHTILGFVAALALSIPATLAIDWAAPIITTLNAINFAILSTIMVVVKGALVPLVMGVLNFGLVEESFLINNPVTNKLWLFALGIANAIYLLVLLIATIAIILRVNTGIYNLKKFLGGFIVAVILTNFSFIIFKAIFSLGQTLTTVVYGVPHAIGLTEPDVNSGTKLLLFINSMLDNLDAPFMGSWDLDVMAEKMLLFAVAIIILWVWTKIAILLIERIIRLFVAVVIAPVIFAVSLLPNFQKAAAGWWGDITKWIIVLPLTLFVIMLSFFFFSQAGLTKPEHFSFDYLQHKINVGKLSSEIKKGIKSIGAAYNTPITLDHRIYIAAEDAEIPSAPGTTPSAPGTPSPISGPNEPFKTPELFWFVLALYCLYLAGNMSNMLKLGAVMTGIVDTPGKFFKPIQGLAKSIIQSPVSKWATRQTGALIQGAYADAAGKKGRIGRFETWRTAQTGVMGAVVNPVGWAAQQKAIREEQGRGRAFEGAEDRRKALEAGLNQDANRRFGRNWNDLKEEEQQTLYGTPTQQWLPNSVKRRADAYNYMKGKAKFAGNQLVKLITTDERRALPVDELETDLFGTDAVKAKTAFQLLRMKAGDNSDTGRIDARNVLSRADLPAEFQKQAAAFVGKGKGISAPTATASEKHAHDLAQHMANAVNLRAQWVAAHGNAVNEVTNNDLKAMAQDNDSYQALNDKNFIDIEPQIDDVAAATPAYQALSDRIKQYPKTSDNDLHQLLTTAGVANVDTRNAMLALAKRSVSAQAIQIRSKLQATAAQNGQGISELVLQIKGEIDPAHADQLAMTKLDIQLANQDRAKGQQLASMAINQITLHPGPRNVITTGGHTHTITNTLDVSDASHAVYQALSNAGLRAIDKLGAAAAAPIQHDVDNFLQTVYGLNTTVTRDMTIDDALRYLRAAGVNLDNRTPPPLRPTPSPWKR